MELVQGFSGGALAVTVAYFVFKTWFEKKLNVQFDKELTKFKSELDKQNTKELERFKSDLKIAASQRETQYRELQGRRFDVVTEYFGRLYDLFYAVHDYVEVGLHCGVDGEVAAQRKALALREYMPAYLKCTIFLPKSVHELAAKFNNRLQEVLWLYNDLQTKDCFSSEQRNGYCRQLANDKMELKGVVDEISGSLKCILGVEELAEEKSEDEGITRKESVV